MKNYEIVCENCIKITCNCHFDINQIVDSGQVFRYQKLEEKVIIFSANKFCTIYNKNNDTYITSDDLDYFINYFDLQTDYEEVKNQIKNILNMDLYNEVIEHCFGIRILKQDVFETVISFIISSNNNIKRIQKIIEGICKKFGTKMNGFYAFPTLTQLKNASVEDYLKLGAGYRAKYLKKVCEQLEDFDFNAIYNISTQEAINKFVALSGIGPKVADCILLFAYNKQDVFPVDTWIEKIYNHYFNDNKIETNRTIIRKNLTNLCKNYSGYIQQYLFYLERLKSFKIF